MTRFRSIFAVALASAIAAVVFTLPTSSAPVSPDHYQVAAGETFRTIAARLGLSESALACANATTSTCPSVTGSLAAGRIIHLSPVTTPTTVAATTTTAQPTTTTAAPTTSTIAPTTTVTPTTTVAPTTTAPPVGSSFLETFDGTPAMPMPWSSPNWDVSIESRAAQYGDLAPVDAQHDAACGSPGQNGTNTHMATGDSYANTLFQCANHMMSSINSETDPNNPGYAVVYLTPNVTTSWANGTTTIKFDVSTYWTASRDWWDVWITPMDQALQMPIGGGIQADLNGPQKDSILITTEEKGGDGIGLGVYTLRNYVQQKVAEAFSMSYKRFVNDGLGPSAIVRDTVQIDISRTHIRVGYPKYNVWYVDTDIAPLPFTDGIIQIGHHSYTPTKDCPSANTPPPDYPASQCRANTWHWDNVSISNATPFQIVKADKRVVYANSASKTMTFSQPAPAGAMLRFRGRPGDTGEENIAVSFNGGAFQPSVQTPISYHGWATSRDVWMPIPAGTTTVTFRGTGQYWYAADASLWIR